MTDTILYGFDARKSAYVADPQWSELRRAQYLLRPEISRPFSVDPHVWGRAFITEPSKAFAPDYWTDLAALRDLCTAKHLGEDSVTLVALAVRGNTDQVRALFMPCTPSKIDLVWQSLGWDVADSGLISALSNCGYSPEAAETLGRVFGSKLNEHGLFNDLAAAELFCALSDERVAEHAPFFVHQILFIPLVVSGQAPPSCPPPNVAT